MTRRSWKYIVALVTLWLVIIIYMAYHMVGLVDDSNRSTAALHRKERHVEVLEEQNNKFKKMVAELRIDKEKLQLELNSKNSKLESEAKVKQRRVDHQAKQSRVDQKTVVQVVETKAFVKPSKLFERTRRRTTNEIKELWYFISAEVTKINKKAGDGQVKKALTQMLGDVQDMHNAITIGMAKLNSLDGRSEWFLKESTELSALVQKRIHYLQNPRDCGSAKKLVCQINKGCGYGCQIHHVLYCFIVAFGAQRTLVIDSTGWRYSSTGWHGIFKPVSDTCTSYSGNLGSWNGESSLEKNVLLPIVDSLYPRPPHMPLAVPEDIAGRLSLLHGHPFVWWIGQFAKYLLRYTPKIEKEIKAKQEKLGFKKPIVGVHVRRTDKINLEAAFHGIEEYMYWVDHFYERLERHKKIDKRRVFLASDDPSVLPTAKEKYPNYEFVSDSEISKSAGLESRYSDDSLHGIIFDIQMLSECDFLVCTFSSQVCRLAYEMMQALHPDASGKFQSLDDIYYFGGQSGHNVKAIYTHKSRNAEEMDLELGDVIGIAGNHWDGFSKGTNERTGSIGLYPSYKVEDIMDVAKFPTYDGA